MSRVGAEHPRSVEEALTDRVDRDKDVAVDAPPPEVFIAVAIDRIVVPVRERAESVHAVMSRLPMLTRERARSHLR